MNDNLRGCVEIISEYDGDWGNPLWFMARGHVDKAAFVAEIKNEYEYDYPIEKVHHTYAHNRPAGRNDPGVYIIELVRGPGRGNYPITYIEY